MNKDEKKKEVRHAGLRILSDESTDGQDKLELLLIFFFSALTYHGGRWEHHSATRGVVQVLAAVLRAVPVHPLQAEGVYRDGKVARRQSAGLRD